MATAPLVVDSAISDGPPPGTVTEVALSPQPQAASRTHKRIIVCCDGTWQDGVVVKQRWQYSNVIKIARTLNHEDARLDPPISQIVFYQTGIGSEKNIYSEYIEGATGASLAQKVQEAYAFIAHNYNTGDEIFLFGFSRGAYTARMCAAFIGEIGVLDKRDMDHFADIFIAYQKRGKATDPKEKEEYAKVLEPWNSPNSKGRLRAQADLGAFTIKVVGVWDTVGSLGLPEELTLSKNLKQLFGFNDRLLGTHIQYAFHAMALHETRADFNVAKFEQTQEGRDKGQVLKQVWFSGSHSDVGGGWQRHDLSDIALVWMVSNIENLLSIDVDYLCGIPNPVAEWGAQTPHNPQIGIFKLSKTIHRDIPAKTDETTNEMIHPSVMFQSVSLPIVDANVKKNPTLLTSLTELEGRIKAEWPYSPGNNVPEDDDSSQAKEEDDSQESEKKMLLKLAKSKVELSEIMEDEGGKPRYQETWLGKIIHELIG